MTGTKPQVSDVAAPAPRYCRDCAECGGCGSTDPCTECGHAPCDEHAVWPVPEEATT